MNRLAKKTPWYIVSSTRVDITGWPFTLCSSRGISTFPLFSWSWFPPALSCAYRLGRHNGPASFVCYSTQSPKVTSGGGPVKVHNPRPRGIVPIGEDYGGYDEDKHEEYEKEAEKRQLRIKRLKKIISSATFVSILLTVVWARNRKQRLVNEYTKNVTFLPKDHFFEGSSSSMCVMKTENGEESVVLLASMVQDGTMHFITNSMTLRDGDVVVASFPKTGTTWVQEIVYLLENNLDFQKAKSNVMEDRFPFLEYPYPGVKSVDKKKSPRLIKTHLPYSFLPKGASSAKIIYCTRNPKDTVVSYYYFTRMLSYLGYSGSFREFVDKFIKNQLPYCPFFGHLESYLRHKEDPNVLIVSYEELSKEPIAVIQNIARFLGKSLSSEDIDKIVKHTSFQAMSENPSVNYSHWDSLGLRKKGEASFMRQGKVGDWRNHFDVETNEKFDKWLRDSNRTSINFEYYTPKKGEE